MMHKPHSYGRWRWRILLAAGLVLLALVATSSRQQPVQAKPDYWMAFRATYPNVVGTSLDSCSTCHTSAIPSLNPYGLAYAGSRHNFQNIESADSDGDGASNLVEILALTFPGDANSKPAASPTPTQVSSTPTATPTPVGPDPTATATQVGTPATPTVTRTPDGDDDDHDKTPEATRTPDGDDDDDHDKTPEATRTPEPTETPDGEDTPGPTETPEATRTATAAPHATFTPRPTETEEPDETPEPSHTPTPTAFATLTATHTPEPTEIPEATETPETHETPGASVALQGVIENLGPDDLTVAGQRVQIDIHTEIHQDHGAVAVGAEVDVQAEVRAASTLYARRIDILNSPVVAVHTYLPLFIRRR